MICSSAFQVRQSLIIEQSRGTHLLPSPSLIRLDGGRLPDFVVMPGDVEVLAIVQGILDHQLVELQLELLQGRQSLDLVGGRELGNTRRTSLPS